MWLSRKGGLQYVARNNPAVADWTKATLNTDGNWHTLNLTGIIPATAKLVILHVNAGSSTAGNGIRFRPVGSTHGFADDECLVHVANNANQRSLVITPIAGSVDYAIVTSAGFSVDVAVLGWFV